jgi:phosphoribosylaminoimidazole-succinocarboxamide synthase
MAVRGYMEFLRSGKVKDVYEDGDHLVFKFSNRISVFDKIIPNIVPDKGASLCRTASYWFIQVEKELGIATHYLSTQDQTTMLVKKFRTQERVRTTGEKNYVIPLEFVIRYYAAGSLLDRISSGKVSASDLGMKSMPAHGEKLPQPYLEVTTKFEKFDRPLTRSEACEIAGISGEELDEIFETALRIDTLIDRNAAKSGLIHADGKKEFALDDSRQPVVVDTFGTADEDRFWDREKLLKGTVEEYSKEFVRQYYRRIGYHESLYAARSAGKSEPEIPPLPDEMVVSVSSLYRKMYEMLTLNRW